MKKINAYLKDLTKNEKDFITNNQTLIDTIIEEDLDTEEIRYLISTAKYTIEQKKKQQITMKLPVATLKKIKLIAKQEGLPYQTLISSILHKYTR